MTDLQKERIEFLLKQFEPTEFHHGDCFGSDEESHEIAFSLKIWTVVWAPIKKDFRSFREGDDIKKPQSYLARNRSIVDSCDLLLATPAEYVEQDRGGTWYTVRYAFKQNKPAIIILPDGTMKKYGMN